jgi:hypothetical protein
VLVSLIPSSVYDLGRCWIVVEPFQFLFRYCRFFVLFLAGLVQRIVNGGFAVSLRSCGYRGCLGRLRGVIEEGATEACYFVEQEMVDFVVL